MKYIEKWDLSSIPDPKLKSEWARRNGAKSGPARIKDDPATEEHRKKERERIRKYRANKAKAQNS